MTLEELNEIEQRRKEKAATMPRVEIPPAITETVEERMEKLKQKFISNPIQQETLTDNQREEKIRELTKSANIPHRHSGLRHLDATRWSEQVNGLKEKLGTGFIVALLGVRGVGKTQIGVELIRHQIERLKSSQFTTAMDIFLAIKSTYRNDSEIDEREIVAEFCKPRLLVIDEIQERAESPWEDRILTHLLNRRYNDEKDTLLIGNDTLEKFASSMGSSIVSRLNETGGIIVCDWESFRK
jgi:DNA replication protein DnaC